MVRYFDCRFEIVSDISKADVCYTLKEVPVGTLKIHPCLKFWRNLFKAESMPQWPSCPYEGIDFLFYHETAEGRFPDTIASTFFLLSGYEELMSDKRDSFDRFLSSYSILGSTHFYSKPAVEIYRRYFYEQLRSVRPELSAVNLWNDRRFALFFSHDVDAVYKYRKTFLSLLKIAAKPQKFSLKEFVVAKKQCERDPYFRGFYYLLDLARQLQLKSTYFFITKVRNKYDDFYLYDSKPIQKILNEIRDEGHEIGLHGSLDSYSQLSYLQEELELLGEARPGLRQHYLRYNIRVTPTIHHETSIAYDSTLAFADQIGFRRGTCLPYKVYNFEKREAGNYFCIPFVAMDVTLKNYMKLSPERALALLTELMDEVVKYGGVFGLLWHPGNCSDEWMAWLKECLEKILLKARTEACLSLSGSQIIERLSASHDQ